MSSLTLAETILSRSVGRTLRAGEIAVVEPDVAMVHDSIAPSVIDILESQLKCRRIPHPERIAIGIDHVSPAANLATAEAQKRLRAWVKDQGIRQFFEGGRGIAHQVLIEERIAAPGRLVVGSDSHSTAYGAVAAFGAGMGSTDMALVLATGSTWMKIPETIRIDVTGSFPDGVSAKDLALEVAAKLGAAGATYCALEFHGLEDWTPASRTTLASMAVEVGAKAGLVSPRGLEKFGYEVPSELLGAEEAESYAQRLEIDLSALSPRVALPNQVDRVLPLEEVEPVSVDVVYVGTCTNGRQEDIAVVAKTLDGQRVAEGTRLIVVPASSEVLQAVVADGNLEKIIAAGGVIGPPGCGACIGRHMGVLAAGEVCVFTGNRNFRGRMGSPEAEIYLASPEVAARAALTGRLESGRQTIEIGGV